MTNTEFVDKITQQHATIVPRRHRNPQLNDNESDYFEDSVWKRAGEVLREPEVRPNHFDIAAFQNPASV
jgi:hypothetical protein